MGNYIFTTNEGCTFQPDSETPEPDVENCQVVGFAEGDSEKEAFDNLVEENNFLLATSFNEIICMELKKESHRNQFEYFYLDEKRKIGV